MPFETARDLLRAKGWTLIPDLEPIENVFEFHGSEYRLRWQEDRVVRITKDDEEIKWQDLPEQLKGLL